MKISEIFRSLQGEGRYAGNPSVFIRFAGCNLRCKFGNSICDTPYASYSPEINRMTLKEVDAKLNELVQDSDDIVITGGEPSMHFEAIMELSKLPVFRNRRVTVETNGTLAVRWPELWFLSISPKLTSAGNEFDLFEYGSVIRAITWERDYQLKFVVDGRKETFQEVREFVGQCGFAAHTRTVLMPEGVTAEDVDNNLETVAHLALENGMMFTDRLHLRIWGNSRGT